jgi:hypothetical protein
MSFTNAAVDLESLPRFDEVALHRLDPRYPRLVLAVALIVELPALIGATLIVFLVPPIPLPLRIAIEGAVLGVLAFVPWLAFRWVSAIRYAVREHDVIRRSGLFWQTEIVQPIKRIQHVEQTQGPLDKWFGLSTIKLYSAGTGNVTLRIPGLEAATAAAIGRLILSFHEPGAHAAAEQPAAHLPDDPSDG